VGGGLSDTVTWWPWDARNGISTVLPQSGNSILFGKYAADTPSSRSLPPYLTSCRV
jgi:hypothetical protein